MSAPASWLQRLGRLITSPWRSGGGSAGGTSNHRAEPATYLDAQLENLVTEAAGKSSEIRAIVHRIAESYWRTGYADAQRGQRLAEFAEVTSASAKLLRQKIAAEATANEEQVARRAQTNQEILDAAQKRFSARHDHLELLGRLFRRNTRSLSAILGVGYLVVAGLLIVADVPLALRLTQEGFDLEYGQNFQITDLFRYPLVVFQDNWEVLILAGGLALCTVFIKIFFDKRIATVIPEPSEDGAAPRPSELDLSSRVPLWLEAAVLLLTLGTIVSLGAFRYSTQDAERRLTSSLETLFTASQHDWITFATFVLITLLFPVIGGACLSIGLNHLHNRTALKRARRDLDEARREYLAQSTVVERIRNSLTEWHTVHQWCTSSDEFLGTAATLLRASYEHGYARGWMDALAASSDVASYALRLRAFAVAHRVRDLLRTPPDRVEQSPSVAMDRNPRGVQ